MRIYQTGSQMEMQELRCNRCGKKLNLRDGFPQEGFCPVDVEWGYFSRKDGELHSFDLCEDCYEEMLRQFVIPVQIRENTELL